MAQIGGMEKGVVRIGTFNSACVEWMPSLLRGFEKDYPNIRIDIYQGSYDDVYQWLKDGIVDLDSFHPPVQEICPVHLSIRTRSSAWHRRASRLRMKDILPLRN